MRAIRVRTIDCFREDPDVFNTYLVRFLNYLH